MYNNIYSSDYTWFYGARYFFALLGGGERYGCSLKPCEGVGVHPVSASYDTLTVQYKTLRVLRLRDLTCTLLRRGKKYGI